MGTSNCEADDFLVFEKVRFIGGPLDGAEVERCPVKREPNGNKSAIRVIYSVNRTTTPHVYAVGHQADKAAPIFVLYIESDTQHGVFYWEQLCAPWMRSK